MSESAVVWLSGWGSFYVITGTAAAALTGLTFVIISLIAGARLQASEHSVAAFSTPTVVHFCYALLLSGLLTAPWPALWQVALLLAVVGVAGMSYAFVVVRRLRRHTSYRPDREDWIWYAMLPLLAYGGLVVAAALLASSPAAALFVSAGVTLGLVFISIRNAWDSVTYMVVQNSPPREERKS